MNEALAQSSIQPGLYLESAETSRTSRGDVYAVVHYPFATIGGAFTNPQSWCEALILHLNVKYCRPVIAEGRTVLSVAIGKATEQSLSETHQVEFVFQVRASGTDYMQVALDANKGPFGTRDYHMVMESIALEGERSFLHVQYCYSYGFTARIAMRTYLATSGHSKVGFTRVAGENSGRWYLVQGVRGALERNTMRYYLAIDAYLGALTTPVPQRFEDSLERWFTATEHHALQLHEVDRDTYFTMKRHEHLRQQTFP